MISAPPRTDRQRIIEHGEVFTPSGLVDDMLDLVGHECEREDSRFLEPACGDGNFLAAVLRRRLAGVDLKHRAPSQWEAHALLGLACLYGVELLPDNASMCRRRLSELFHTHYVKRYGEKARPEVKEAAEHIVNSNIVQGDALNMRGPTGAPLVLTEWALVGRGRFKRRLFEYRELTPRLAPDLSLFAAEHVRDEEGAPVFVPQLLRDLPPVHYLDLVRERAGA